MEIVVLISLIFLNGLLAMSEIAIVTSKKIKLQKLIDNGDQKAIIALELSNEPTKFLSTIQIGITSIGVLNGIVGESALASPFASFLITLGLSEKYSSFLATFLVVAVITYLSIVIGELVPKRIGQSNPEAIAKYAATPINFLAKISKPFVFILTNSTNFILKLLGIKENNQNEVTEEEIHAVLEEGNFNGVIEENEHNMVKNVFKLDDRQIISLMVPKSDIVFLNINSTFNDSLEIIEKSNFDKFPVVNENLDSIIGVLDTKKLLLSISKGNKSNISENLTEPLYVPETLTGMELLEKFKLSHHNMAFVIDEFGETLGLITLHDLIEAITGEFKTRTPEESWAIQREDGSWLLDGHIPIQELKDYLSIQNLPDEDLGRYHTLSGLIMLLTGEVPKTSHICEIDEWKFEVIDMDGKTIDKVLAYHIKKDS